MSVTDWGYLIETNGESVTLHHLTEGEVDTSSYPSSDLSDSSSSVKAIISGWSEFPRTERTVQPIGNFTRKGLFAIMKTTVTVSEGDYIERANGDEYDVIMDLTDVLLTRSQYRLLKLQQRDV